MNKYAEKDVYSPNLPPVSVSALQTLDDLDDLLAEQQEQF